MSMNGITGLGAPTPLTVEEIINQTLYDCSRNIDSTKNEIAELQLRLKTAEGMLAHYEEARLRAIAFSRFYYSPNPFTDFVNKDGGR